MNPTSSNLNNRTNMTSKSWNVTILNDLNDVMFERLAPAIAVLIFIMVVSVAGNTLICYIFACKLRRSNQNFLLLCLGISDLLSACLGIPSEIWDMRNYYLYESAETCKAMRFLTTFPTLASILVLLVIAVDRYRKICKPLHHQMHLPHSRICLVVIIAIALAFSVPTLYIYGHRTFPSPIEGINGHDCSIADEYKDKAYPLIYESIFTVLFVLFTFILIGIYLRIWLETRRHREYMKSHAMVGKNSSDDVPSSTNYDSSAENIADTCTESLPVYSVKTKSAKLRPKIFVKHFHRRHGRDKTLTPCDSKNYEPTNGGLQLKTLRSIRDTSPQFSSDESIVHSLEWQIGESNTDSPHVDSTDISPQVSEKPLTGDDSHFQRNNVDKSELECTQSETDKELNPSQTEDESQKYFSSLHQASASPHVLEFEMVDSETQGSGSRMDQDSIAQETQRKTHQNDVDQCQPDLTNSTGILIGQNSTHNTSIENKDDKQRQLSSSTNESSNFTDPGVLVTESKYPSENQSQDQNGVSNLIHNDPNNPYVISNDSKCNSTPTHEQILSSQEQLEKDHSRLSRVSFFQSSNDELQETESETEGIQSPRYSGFRHPTADRSQKVLVKSKSTQSLMTKRVKKALKATRTTVIACVITIGFIVSYLPHLILIILRSVKTDFEHHLDDVPLNFYNIFLRSYFANNVLNIFVYGSMNLEFRSQLVALVKRRKSSTSC